MNLKIQHIFFNHGVQFGRRISQDAEKSKRKHISDEFFVPETPKSKALQGFMKIRTKLVMAEPHRYDNAKETFDTRYDHNYPSWDKVEGKKTWREDADKVTDTYEKEAGRMTLADGYGFNFVMSELKTQGHPMSFGSKIKAAFIEAEKHGKLLTNETDPDEVAEMTTKLFHDGMAHGYKGGSYKAGDYYRK